MTTSNKKQMNLNRRQFLTASAAVTVAAGAGISLTSTSAQAVSIKTKAHIVVVGSGLAGLAMVNRLRKQLDGAKNNLA